MRAIKARDTKPELVVRSLLHQLGYRYRLHEVGLPGRPDIVFRRSHKVIFVHGCFWHDHEGCPKAYKPKSRQAFWEGKFKQNKGRDRAVLGALAAMNWSALVVWECEAVDGDSLRNSLSEFLGPRADQGGT